MGHDIHYPLCNCNFIDDQFALWLYNSPFSWFIILKNSVQKYCFPLHQQVFGTREFSEREREKVRHCAPQLTPFSPIYLGLIMNRGFHSQESETRWVN